MNSKVNQQSNKPASLSTLIPVFARLRETKAFGEATQEQKEVVLS